VLDALRAWGTEGMYAALADDVVFSNFIDPGASPTMAVLAKPLRSRAEVAAACDRMRDVFPNGLKRTIRWVTAEEDRVVVEDSVHGASVVRPDKEFRMRTLKVFHVRDGKIVEISQSLDSWYCEDYSAEAVHYVCGATSTLEVPAPA
jgi:ketosteroid isomerase-like protein